LAHKNSLIFLYMFRDYLLNVQGALNQNSILTKIYSYNKSQRDTLFFKFI
jgi:hypothetical protein